MADPDKLFQDALNKINAVQLPGMDEQRLKLEMLVQQGVLTPQQAALALQNGNAFDTIETDPALEQAQYDALSKLQLIGDNEGLTPIDRAKINQIQTETNITSKGRDEAIMSNARERGVGGSGLEMANRMLNEQAGADRASAAGLDVAAMAQQRAFDAMLASGQLAGEMEQADFSRQATGAQAQNAIDAMNAQMTNQNSLFNTNVANAAMEQNLNEKQRISDSNTGVRNAEQQHNKGLYQTDYENRMAKATGQANVLNQWAGQEAKEQSAKRGYKRALEAAGIQMAGKAIGGAIGGPAGAAAGGEATKMPQGYNEGYSYDMLPSKNMQSPGYAHGGIIGGEEMVEGDHPVNDTVDARLSPGEAVLPKSVVENPDYADDFLKDLKKDKGMNCEISPSDVATVLKAMAEMRGM